MKYILLLSTLFSLQLRGQTVIDTTIYSREQLIEDIRYCRDFHEKHNTNLYAYRSKAYIDSMFDDLEDKVVPMDAITFFKYMSIVTSSISDGHCLLFPSEE
ncbi:MAG TPA: hypothetical protein PKC38_04765, partial [Chitinophagales bacterium]|nr:hypothetical protein [Chitinophagales bacterium]